MSRVYNQSTMRDFILPFKALKEEAYMDKKIYWFITVFESLEAGKSEGVKDDSRCWGFFSDKNEALNVLHGNITDLWETVYDYAVLEGFYEGICGHTKNASRHKTGLTGTPVIGYTTPRQVNSTSAFVANARPGFYAGHVFLFFAGQGNRVKIPDTGQASRPDL